jgi:glutamine amidotransferase
MVNGKLLMANEAEQFTTHKRPRVAHNLKVHNLKIPHMGWNQLEPAWENPLLDDVQTGDYTYFVHSYYCDPEEATAVLAWTDYGFPFASIVAKDNIYGLQFHPEKSQSVGLTILQNFVEKL